MRLMVPGIDVATGQPLVEPLDAIAMAHVLLDHLPAAGERMRQLTAASSAGSTFRGIKERAATLDYGDPLVVGWTYLIASDEPDRAQIADALRPLAQRRGMKASDQPLEFAHDPPEDWMDWMLEKYLSVESESPHYVLIVGGPDKVPFHFQSVLDSAASVGRVAFDTLDDLSAYVEKVLKLEDSATGCASEAVVFATDGGLGDPTYYSHQYMAKPLTAYIRDQLAVGTTLVAAEHATRDGLLSALAGRRPALVYTASHGAGSPGAPQELQEKVNGAIVCGGREPDGSVELFTAEHVPDDPFVEGGVFFQFACFGYGTPAESDYNHWLGQDRLNAESDFVAALPKKLLAHPRGPVAYVGHVDLAWLHAFDDPDAPDLIEAWHPRLGPFRSAVEFLLAPKTVGLAMEPMNKRFDIGNAQMASTYDRQKRGTLPDRPDIYQAIVRAFVTRSDAQNYLVFGDPAVYVRIDDG